MRRSMETRVWGDKVKRECSICGGPFIGLGNNSRPVIDGRCCDHCNLHVVFPHRYLEMFKAQTGEVK